MTRAAWAAPWRPGPVAVPGRPVIDLPLPADTVPEVPDAEAPLCGSCGRLLRDPASRARGLGPVCARRVHGRGHTAARAPVPAPRTTPTAELPGQTELALPVQTALTWST